ncbi:hypothetical protein [Streptomyces sp. NPDC058307]|uniref:hypothetical protein n=1 Tax=Streptomyces sp. NPDC058307 TaxID=3346439 RepID=UPI0036E32DAA
MDSAKYLAAIDSLCARGLTAADGEPPYGVGPGYRSSRPGGTGTLRVHGERGDEIPEPWAMTSRVADDLGLWQPPGEDRWIALGVDYRDETDEVHVLAVASDIDPL